SDQRFRKPLLYPLSYWGTLVKDSVSRDSVNSNRGDWHPSWGLSIDSKPGLTIIRGTSIRYQDSR
ncbi:MAG TPA: hypothetical protein PKI15_10620, partial [Candidatus Cloacimonadota bacterium]|nr:hypothetical protein [Candidatus Cloacimonadota bacterium]